MTILPTFNNIKKIIVESEDHNTRNVFEIRLGEETEETPESGDRDYPIGRLTAFAESEYNGSGTEGPAEYVLDEDEGTHWHTNWRTNDAQDVEKRWIGLELEEPRGARRLHQDAALLARPWCGRLPRGRGARPRQGS